MVAKASRRIGGKKKPVNAYFVFAKQKREEVKAANPTFSFGEIGKALGKMWSDLSVAEKEVFGVAKK